MITPALAAGLVCSLLNSSTPDCFRAREVATQKAPVVKASFLQYGKGLKTPDLIRIGALLTTRFGIATDHKIELEILDFNEVPLPNYPRDLAAVRKTVGGNDPVLTSDERLTRLWYYGHNPDVKGELHQQLLARREFRATMEQSDVILALSAPQFEGIGQAAGAYALVEQPMDAGWGLSDGGMIFWDRDERIVDELLHELGHVLGLNHAAEQCMKLPDLQLVKCCANSPSGNDVMSYCRDRAKVKDDFWFRYTSCNVDFLANTVAPNLIKGGPRVRQTSGCP